MKLAIVGQDGGTHVGGSLLRAAVRLGYAARLFDAQAAWSTGRLGRLVDKVFWHGLDRRTPGMRTFGDQVVAGCGEAGIELLLVTGEGSLDAAALRRLGAARVRRVNFTTDDPWNRGLGSRWFRAALREYDLVLTPRHANVADLVELGCRRVAHLPFAYDDGLFFPEGARPDEASAVDGRLLFVGGADADRVPLIRSLLDAGVPMRLCGGYWDRDPALKPLTLGRVDAPAVRRLTGAAAINLCLVRRANRDGHVMRSYEIPAAGGCILAERTADHEALFGPEGEAALYFTADAELVDKARHLMARPDERHRLAAAARARVVAGPNTYRDRLQTMLALAAGPP